MRFETARRKRHASQSVRRYDEVEASLRLWMMRLIIVDYMQQLIVVRRIDNTMKDAGVSIVCTYQNAGSASKVNVAACNPHAITYSNPAIMKLPEKLHTHRSTKVAKTASTPKTVQ